MYIWIVFLALTLLEGVVAWMKWDEVNDYAELGRDVSGLTGFDKKKAYSFVVKVLLKIKMVARWLLFIIIPAILLINLIVSLIIGGILELIF